VGVVIGDPAQAVVMGEEMMALVQRYAGHQHDEAGLRLAIGGKASRAVGSLPTSLQQIVQCGIRDSRRVLAKTVLPRDLAAVV